MASKSDRDYAKEDIVVHWRPALCQHCENCITGLPEVFKLKARPWVNLYGADRATIAKQIDLCPKNEEGKAALSYTMIGADGEERCDSCHRPVSICGELGDYKGSNGTFEDQCDDCRSDRAMEE